MRGLGGREDVPDENRGDDHLPGGCPPRTLRDHEVQDEPRDDQRLNKESVPGPDFSGDKHGDTVTVSLFSLFWVWI